MNGGITGRYIPGDSMLHRMDPRAKLFSFLIMIVAVIFTDSVPGYAVTGLILVLISGMSGIRAKVLFDPVMRMYGLFMMIFIMNALFYSSDDPIWSFWFINLSKEGLVQGANVVLRIMLIIVMSGVLTMTTTPMGLMAALEALVRPLKYIRLPAEEIAMILSISIQFIPTLLEESETIKKAQIARGARFESDKLKDRAMALVPMLIPIFLSAFKRADELSVAMEARGYRGAKNRTVRKTEKMDAAGLAAMGLSLVLSVAEYFI